MSPLLKNFRVMQSLHVDLRGERILISQQSVCIAAPLGRGRRIRETEDKRRSPFWDMARMASDCLFGIPGCYSHVLCARLLAMHICAG
jgi:hypothetical protein